MHVLSFFLKKVTRDRLGNKHRDILVLSILVSHQSFAEHSGYPSVQLIKFSNQMKICSANINPE
jgi:hypothetical protein